MDQIVRVLGDKAWREFTFERYRVSAGNEYAFQKTKAFNPSTEDVYLWGRGRLGKTHLAYAAARRYCLMGGSAVAVTMPQLVRTLRMRSPEEEQRGIDGFVKVDVLVLDDLGSGGESVYARDVLKEILEARDFRDRGGLIVTSRYSPKALAVRWCHDALAVRLEELCEVIEIKELRVVS
jgi:DNA replication protein DnaC